MPLSRANAAWLAPLLVAVTFAAGSQGTVASATTCSGKCALAQLSPSAVAAGSTSTFTFTLTNDASPQSLGSADLTAPAGFVIAAQPAPTITDNGFTGASAATVQVSADISTTAPTYALALRNLSIPPGDWVTVRFQVTVPCSSAGSQWSLLAKQANNFNGSPGNDFVTDPSTTLGTAVSGSCLLSFADQPANADVNQDITSRGFQPAATPPVVVRASDGHGNSVSGVTVTVSLVSPGGVAATLGGVPANPPITDGTGTVEFAALSINHLGYFQFQADAAGFPSTKSAVFLVAGASQSCESASCGTTLVSTKSTGAKVTAINQAAGDILSTGLGGYFYSCQDAAQGGYTSVSDAVGFDVWQSDGRSIDSRASAEVTIDLSKQAVNLLPNNGASFYQVCYASSAPFLTRTAPLGLGITTIPGSNTPFYFGLLPDCAGKTAPTGPCVVSRSKTGAGDVVVTFLGAPGDLWARM
jgi:hypothetical protein